MTQWCVHQSWLWQRLLFMLVGLKILTRMAYCSVGIDLQTVVQEKMPPVVAEAGFTPLDISYLKRESDRKVG
jgi:hypothetical protein